MDPVQDSSDDDVEIVSILSGETERFERPPTPYRTNRLISSDDDRDDDQEPTSASDVDDAIPAVRDAEVAPLPEISYSPVTVPNDTSNAAVLANCSSYPQFPPCNPNCIRCGQRLRNRSLRAMRGNPRHNPGPYQDRRPIRAAPVYAPHQTLWMSQYADLERRRLAFANQNNPPQATALVQEQQAQSSTDPEQVSEILEIERPVESIVDPEIPDVVEPAAAAPRELERPRQHALACNIPQRHYVAFENLVTAIVRSSCDDLPMDNVAIQSTIDYAWAAMENSFRHAVAPSIPEENIHIFRGATMNMIRSYTTIHTYTSPDNLDKCMICINFIKNRDEVRRLPCRHFFHQFCIDQWLIVYCICPICRRDIRPSLHELLNATNK